MIMEAEGRCNAIVSSPRRQPVRKKIGHIEAL